MQLSYDFGSGLTTSVRIMLVYVVVVVVVVYLAPVVWQVIPIAFQLTFTVTNDEKDGRCTAIKHTRDCCEDVVDAASTTEFTQPNTAATQKRDKLSILVELQTPDGSWMLDDHLAECLEVPLDQLKEDKPKTYVKRNPHFRVLRELWTVSIADEYLGDIHIVDQLRKVGSVNFIQLLLQAN
ncbi:unnamed protein product [Echinostoma caproni]|uniref:Pecanex_C domain-containing protein n=1 Tax=Echinostoma caproni TaxID=27848 RepID=A0A183B0V3_9TREM|nr:unnamed protein product [Echinostoma caproni]